MKLIYILIILLVSAKAYSQGCSDAGICSLPEHSDSTQKVFVVGFEQGIGIVDANHTVLNSNIEFYFDISQDFTISGFLPYIFNLGEYQNLSGIGDPIVVLSYRKELFGLDFEFDGGVRLPLGEDDNSSIYNTALPMIYQQGQGSTDLLFRMGLNLKKWDFMAGVQIPVAGPNGNSFDWDDKQEIIIRNVEIFENTIIEPTAVEYEESIRLERSLDLIARVRYNLAKTGKISYNVGLLGIYAPFESAIYGYNPTSSVEIQGVEVPIDPDGMRQQVGVEGSDGLVLNGIFGLDYMINESLFFVLEAGLPFITRETEPSGLDRSLQLNLGIYYQL